MPLSTENAVCKQLIYRVLSQDLQKKGMDVCPDGFEYSHCFGPKILFLPVLLLI